MTDSSLISCRGITKSYKKGANLVTPLEKLDLDVPRGEFLALMGPSGSGKTTLLNLISGIDSPTAGTLTIGGTDISTLNRRQLTRWRAANVGYIFQLYHLVPVLTAFENVELPLLLSPLSKKERRAKVEAALSLVGLADEPTGDLDRESANHILSLLRALARDHGKTIVMVTHDPNAAAAADRTLHLEKGVLLESAAGSAVPHP